MKQPHLVLDYSFGTDCLFCSFFFFIIFNWINIIKLNFICLHTLGTHLVPILGWWHFKNKLSIQSKADSKIQRKNPEKKNIHWKQTNIVPRYIKHKRMKKKFIMRISHSLISVLYFFYSIRLQLVGIFVQNMKRIIRKTIDDAK